MQMLTVHLPVLSPACLWRWRRLRGQWLVVSAVRPVVASGLVGVVGFLVAAWFSAPAICGRNSRKVHLLSREGDPRAMHLTT